MKLIKTLTTAAALTFATTAMAETPSQPSDCEGKGTETEVMSCLLLLDEALNGSIVRGTVPTESYTAANFEARGQLNTAPAVKAKPLPVTVQTATELTSYKSVACNCIATFVDVNGQKVTKKGAFNF